MLGGLFAGEAGLGAVGAQAPAGGGEVVDGAGGVRQAVGDGDAADAAGDAAGGFGRVEGRRRGFLPVEGAELVALLVEFWETWVRIWEDAKRLEREGEHGKYP